MNANLFKMLVLTGGIVSSSLFVACNKDNKMMPTPPKANGGTATITIENVSKPKLFNQSGIFKGDKEEIIKPGEKTSIKFSAGKGQTLMFATMYGTSSDWFFAPGQSGLKLYSDNGKAITGDVSSAVELFDNGTKKTMTEKESKPITKVDGVKPSELMKLDLQYDEVKSEFTLTIENRSSGDHKTPFSRGVWAVSNFDGMKPLSDMPFFALGKMSNPEITDIAQMGDPTKLFAKVKGETGLFTGLSPLLVVVYRGDKNPIFEVGKKDAGLGLKNIAQMGDAKMLTEALKKMPEVKGVYLAGTAPITPSKKEMVRVDLPQGYKVAYVTMYGFSNDWFYANEAAIASTFRGDATASTALFDSGTGLDQFPGAGNKQALFGGTPDKEDKAIQKVGNLFPVPQVKDVLRITIQ